MSGGKRKAERGDARGGGFVLLPHCLLVSEAFRTATPRAVKVLLALCAKHNGFNNGAIALGCRELAVLVDSRNHAANSQALCELILRGLVALEQDHPRGLRLAREYRLTFVATATGPATSDYLRWEVGDAGTRQKPKRGNFRASITSTRNDVSASVALAGDEKTRCDSLNGGHANPPFSTEDPVSVASTHIAYQCKRSAESVRQSPISSPDARGPISAAPEPDDLRRRVLGVLDHASRGSQGQLAAMAQIRPAALSKFLSSSGPLNEQARIRLTCALPKVASAVSERAAV